MRYVCKNPPGGGGERNPYQFIDYTVCICAPYNCRFQMKIKKDGDKPAFLIGAPCIYRANA